MTYYTLFTLKPSTRLQREGNTFDIVRFPDGAQITKNEDGFVTLDKYPFKEGELVNLWQPSDELEWNIAVELLKEEVNNI